MIQSQNVSVKISGYCIELENTDGGTGTIPRSGSVLPENLGSDNNTDLNQTQFVIYIRYQARLAHFLVELNRAVYLFSSTITCPGGRLIKIDLPLRFSTL